MRKKIRSVPVMAIIIPGGVLASAMVAGLAALTGSTLTSTDERIHPLLLITSPVDKAAFSDGKIVVKGTAFDKESGIRSVGVKVMNGAYLPATSSADGKYSTWTVSIPSLTPGDYRLTARAQDGSGNLWWDNVYVTVSALADKVVPSISAPSNMIVHATGVLTSVSLGTPSVSDNSGKAPIVTEDAPAKFPIGSSKVTWTATDSRGNVATDQQLVEVVDLTRPNVEVKSPLAYAKLSFVPTKVKVTGTASDIGSGIAAVEVAARLPDLSAGQVYVMATSTDNWNTWSADVTVTNSSFTRILARVTDNVGAMNWQAVQVVYTVPIPKPAPVVLQGSVPVPTPTPTPTPIVTGTTAPSEVKNIYPTKDGGREWFMNMDNPAYDGVFMTGSRESTRAVITQNADDSWRVSGKEYPESYRYQVRMIVGTPPGEEQWKNIEWTAYVKPVRTFGSQDWMGNELYDAFILYARGGIHSGQDPCAGTAMKAAVELRGVTWFKKEVWHSGGYTGSSGVKQSVAPMLTESDGNGHYFGPGKWMGFKAIMYNIDNDSHVKMEIWLDKKGDNTWEKVNEFVDKGDWHANRSDFWDAQCKDANGDLKQRNHIINYGGPWASIRTDYMEWDFKDLSVREIQAQ